MSDPTPHDLLQDEGGCGPLPIAGGVILALGVPGMLYFMGGFGSQEYKNFRDQCRQRELQKSAHHAIRPDYDQIIVKCERELRDSLGLR
jgi:hypothetical protein